jgi:hypothetical protein
VPSFSLRSPLTEPSSVIDVAYWHETDLRRDVRYLVANGGKADMAIVQSDFRV